MLDVGSVRVWRVLKRSRKVLIKRLVKVADVQYAEQKKIAIGER